MINILGQVMVYVYDQDKAVKFWTEKVGFTVVDEQVEQGMRWIELSPQEKAQTTIVLQNKKVLEEMNVGINLGTPSLLFFTDDIEELYQKFINQNITVGPMVEMLLGKTFNFADDEQNYFAILEKIR